MLKHAILVAIVLVSVACKDKKKEEAKPAEAPKPTEMKPAETKPADPVAKADHGWLVVIACDEAQGDVRQNFLPPAVVKKAGVPAEQVKEIDGDDTLVKLLEGWEARERGTCTVVHTKTEAEAKAVAAKFEGTTVGAAREAVK